MFRDEMARMAEMEMEEYHAEVLEMGQTALMLEEEMEDEDAIWERHEAELEAERIRSESELAEVLDMMEMEDWISGRDF